MRRPRTQNDLHDGEEPIGEEPIDPESPIWDDGYEPDPESPIWDGYEPDEDDEEDSLGLDLPSD